MGTPIHIEGAGNTFDFTHVIDVAEGISNIIKHLEKGHKVPTIHLTSSQPVSLKKLAELAIKFGNHHSQFIIKPPRIFDVSNFYGDNTLARTFLNWTPKINIEIGVPQLISDFSIKNSNNTEDKLK